MTDDYSPTALSGRFRELWMRCLPPMVTMDPTPAYNDLVRRYHEPGRSYHGWSHLAECLRAFDLAAPLLRNADHIELALWFHDAVYVPGAADNEVLSAALFKQWGLNCFTLERVERICRLILVTTHNRPPNDSDEAYIVDIDLSGFGVQWPDYIKDTRNIRKEQAHVPDEIYYPAHTGFIKSLVDRPRIFYSDFFYTHYEERARTNINRLLAARHERGMLAAE